MCSQSESRALYICYNMERALKTNNSYFNALAHFSLVYNVEVALVRIRWRLSLSHFHIFTFAFSRFHEVLECLHNYILPLARSLHRCRIMSDCEFVVCVCVRQHNIFHTWWVRVFLFHQLMFSISSDKSCLDKLLLFWFSYRSEYLSESSSTLHYGTCCVVDARTWQIWHKNFN